MKKLLLSLGVPALFSTVQAQTTHTVTAVGFTYSPDTVECIVGDDVLFSLSSLHNAVEVSQATFLANGSTSNGGFTVPFGGGSINMSVAGTYYFACANHSLSGMKGVIIVSNATSVKEENAAFSVNVFPTKMEDILNIRMELPVAGMPVIKIFNMLGAEVLSAPTQTLNAGAAQMQLNVASLTAGTYFVRIEFAGLVKTMKVIR